MAKRLDKISGIFGVLVATMTHFSLLVGNATAEEAGVVIPQGVVVDNMDGWLKEFDHVEVVLFNPELENGSSPLVKSGKFHEGIIAHFTQTLNQDEVLELRGLVTGKHKPVDRARCYEPHHGFIFYNKEKKVLGYLEFCLMCKNYRLNPPKGLSNHWDLKGLKKLVEKKGLPAFEDHKEWRTFFKEKAWLEEKKGR